MKSENRSKWRSQQRLRSSTQWSHENGIVKVPLGRSGLSAIIDWDDFELVRQFSWCVLRSERSKTVYAHAAVPIPLRGQYGKDILLHRLIAGASGTVLTDHIDGNGLNCRRANLRSATYPQNVAHFSRPRLLMPYRGVYPTAYGAWRSQIQHYKKRKHLGVFATAEQAAMAYNIAASAIYGEFAVLNTI